MNIQEKYKEQLVAAGEAQLEMRSQIQEFVNLCPAEERKAFVRGICVGWTNAGQMLSIAADTLDAIEPSEKDKDSIEALRLAAAKLGQLSANQANATPEIFE
jgi:hypothetical protein